MHVYLFSPIPYSFLHQRPQKLADEFAGRSLAVTFVEPCGLSEYVAGRKSGLLPLILSSAWYQILGLLALVFPALAAKPCSAGKHSVKEGMEIISMPIVIPANRVDSPFLERLNASIYRQVLRAKVFRYLQPTQTSVAIVENPFWGAVLRKEDFTRITYDCIDEISLFAGKGSVGRYREYEDRLLDIADATFVTAEKLESSLRERNPPGPIVRIPNGVDYLSFQKRALEGGTPPDLQGLAHPVIGYIGVLRDWFDYDLVGELARAMPEATFVMVGPLDFSFRTESLKNISNIRWIGRKEYPDMPLYVNGFDVCLIPFVGTKVSETTNPVKVFEYFALGKPVVASPMHELVPFERDNLLCIASGTRGFLEGIRAGLEEKGSDVSERRKEVARAHSWNVLAEKMLHTACPEAKR